MDYISADLLINFIKQKMYANFQPHTILFTHSFRPPFSLFTFSSHPPVIIFTPSSLRPIIIFTPSSDTPVILFTPTSHPLTFSFRPLPSSYCSLSIFLILLFLSSRHSPFSLSCLPFLPSVMNVLYCTPSPPPPIPLSFLSSFLAQILWGGGEAPDRSRKNKTGGSALQIICIQSAAALGGGGGRGVLSDLLSREREVLLCTKKEENREKTYIKFCPEKAAYRGLPRDVVYFG
jgi:hypothetical protein